MNNERERIAIISKRKNVRIYDFYVGLFFNFEDLVVSAVR